MKNKIESFGVESIREHTHLDLFSLFIAQCGSGNIIEEIVSPKRLSGSAICLCLNGEGEVMIDSNIYSLKKNDMIVLFPQSIFQPISFTDDFSIFIFGLNPDFFTNIDISSMISYFLYIKEHPCISLTEPEFCNIKESCEYIHIKSQRENKLFIKEIVEKHLLALCYEICIIYSLRKPLKKRENKRKEKLFADFLYLINIHYKDSREIEFYAGKLFVTPKYLYQLIKETSGQTPSQWISFVIIVNAKALLKLPDMSVAQIADSLNFPNPSFFSQYFKKHTGFTPKEFRMRNSF